MDRDKRWERVKEAYDLLVEGKGKQATDMVQAMQESYDEGVTDIHPTYFEHFPCRTEYEHP